MDNGANTALIPKPLYADNVQRRINSPNIQTVAFPYLENSSKASSPSPGDKESLAAAYHDQESEMYQHHNTGTKFEQMREDISITTKLEHQHLQHMVETSILNGPPVAKYSLLQFAIQHFRNE